MIALITSRAYQKDKRHLSEVLLSLILVMPVTNAISERSFSSLRRIKNYLRSTMSQVRLNNIMVLHVHKDRTDNLNIIQAANDFVQGSAHRQQILGKFVDSDINQLFSLSLSFSLFFYVLL